MICTGTDERVIKSIVFLLNRFTQENREAEEPTVNEEDHQEENGRTPLAPIKAKYWFRAITLIAFLKVGV